MTIETYVRRLRRWLGTGPRAARIVEEVRSHLEDAADSLGSEPAATRRFGKPGRVAFDFYRRTPSILIERAEPFVLFATTLVTLTFAGAATFFTCRAMLTEGVTPWSFAHLGISSSHAWIALLIWAALALRRHGLARIVRAAGPWVLGLAVVGGGLATYWGVRTGDWEYYLYVINANNAAMGILMLRSAAYLRRPASG